jgi:hypothetical protein
MLIFLLVPVAPPVQAATAFATPAFQRQWEGGEVTVRNFWGPLENATDGFFEPYKEGSIDFSTSASAIPSPGQRLVQYFDKGRMELTRPGRGVVSNGLLTMELITGKVQVGDNTFEQRQPAHVAVVGDPDNTFPTYADLQVVTKPQPMDSIGLTHSSSRLYPGGQIVQTDLYANDPLTVETTTDQNRYRMPKVFVDFRNRVGLETVGYAVTWPVWVNARVGDTQRAVLVQGFERRVLTYTPINPASFRVEFGNIGQHYLAWRYGGSLPASPLPATNQDLSPFANSWLRHGFSLTVNAQGWGMASWRIYQWCSDDPTPPCDAIIGNEIIDGGRATLIFSRANGTVASGTVTFSTGTSLLADGPIHLKLLPYDMAVLYRTNERDGITLCGARFIDLAPKSLVEQYPCGA